MVVYVTTQGSRLTRRGKHLLVKKDGDILHTLFVHKLEQLVLCGNVGLTPPALGLLFGQGIDTVFLRRDGRYLGRLAQPEPKNVFLRRLQFVLCGDPEFCLPAARSLVRGKLANMATILMRIKRTRKSRFAGECAGRIRRMMSGMERAPDLDSLRGFEGRASAVYFAGMRSGFRGDWGFRRRVRRPPTDPVNAVLSLLYTFLMNRMYAALRLAGLDPYPGVMHSLEYGRFSLVLDLVEEFRPMVADTLALSLFNLGILKKDDFVSEDGEGGDGAGGQATDLSAVCSDPLGRMDFVPGDEVSDLPGAQTSGQGEQELERSGKPAVRLVPDAFGRVVEAFERKLGTEFYHPLAGEQMSYQEALVFQARQFRRLLEGEVGVYEPLLLR